MNLGALEQLLAALDLRVNDAQREAIHLGLSLEALSGQLRDLPLSKVVGDLCVAVEASCAAVWFDKATRMAGCAVWSHAAALPSESVGHSTKGCAAVHANARTSRPHFSLLSYAAAPGCELRVALLIERLAADSHDMATYVRARHGRPHDQVLRRLRQRSALPEGAWSPTRRPDVLETRRESLARAGELAGLFQLAATDPQLAAEPLQQTLTRFKTALRMNQMVMVSSGHGSCAAAFSWARLTEPAIRKLMLRGPKALHASDWDEGDHLVFIDRIGDEDLLTEHMAVLRQQLQREGVVSARQLASSVGTDGQRRWTLSAPMQLGPSQRSSLTDA